MRHILLIVLLSLPGSFIFAQEKYWICFNAKDIKNYEYRNNLSAETLKNRERFGLPLYQYSDIPVDPSYLHTLKNMGIEVICKSKWLNSVSAVLSDEQVTTLSVLPFVESIVSIDKNIIITSTATNMKPEMYHVAMLQMQSRSLLENNLTGKGVSIGVIDAGFHKAHTDKYLLHLFEEDKIKAQKDFLDPSRKDLIRENVTDSDYHGRMVLDMIAGYDAEKKIQMGLAVNSNFYLARTEDGAREHRGEEDKWIEAIEWLDSLGVRLVNTSLGYAINMDDPRENYKQEEMDGKTTRISRAAQIAYDEKGIFLVVSAGNEGDNPSWRILSSPADAEGVLSVGATKDNTWDKIAYSSIGPEFLTYLKPNVSCYSPNGTSFSAPAVTGFVACLMERDSTLSNRQLKEIIEKSGHLYPYGNNYIGYGIPQGSRALKMIDQPGYKANALEKHVKGTSVLMRFNRKINMHVVAFHKKNETIVVEQENIAMRAGKLRIKRKPDVKRTTVSLGTGEVIEIFWH